MVDITHFTEQEKQEYELYLKIKNSPEFGILPLPARWYEKFDIPPVKHMSVREFIESRYTINCAFATKDLDPIIINEPQQNGKLVKFIEEEPIPVKIVELPYDPNVRRTEEEIIKLTLENHKEELVQ